MEQEEFAAAANALVPFVAIVTSVIVGYGTRSLVDRFRRSRAVRDTARIEEIVFRISEGLIVPCFALLGALVAVQVSTLPPDLRTRADSIIGALLTLAITLIAARMLRVMIQHYLSRVDALSQVIAVVQRVGQIALWTIGLMVSLSYLGVPITPLLTTLGVGGLATALALQDTLTNFFAGFYILADRPIRVGDYVKLDSGEEGYVIEIGWRSVKMRTLPNNVVIIPNQKLAQTIITNYHLPEQRMSLLVPVGVSYDSDPQRVEEILIEVASTASGEIEGMLSDPAPFVRFIPGFGEYSLDFTLICQVREFVDQYYVQHELRKRIFARLKQEGIEIPFPIRTLQLADGLDKRTKNVLEAGAFSSATERTVTETG